MTYIHGSVVVLYYVRLMSVRTLLYFVHAVLFCRTPLCFCLLFCFSLALLVASFFRFCFCHFFFFPLACRVDYLVPYSEIFHLVPYNIRTHFFGKYAHTDTRVHSHFSNILKIIIKSLIFKKTHTKVPVQYYLFEPTCSFFFFSYFLIFLHRLSFSSFLFFFVRLG